MHQDTSTTAAASEDAKPGASADDTASTLDTSQAHLTARGFSIGRLRVRCLKSAVQMGWGHDEGDSTSRTLFELSNIYEGNRRSATRIIVGRYSIWFFF